MRAEEVHRKKLKELGYKDEVIEELVTKYIANCTYEFAEAYHAELLNIDSVVGRSEQCCDKCGSEYYHTYKCVNTKCENCIIHT